MSQLPDTVEFVPAILSILGGSFMLLSFAVFPKLRNPFGKISMWLAISGIGTGLYPLMGNHGVRSALCYIQSFVGTYFTLVSMFTSTIIVTAIYQIFYSSTVSSIVTFDVTLLKIAYAWGLSAVLSLLPFTTNSYGIDDYDK